MYRFAARARTSCSNNSVVTTSTRRNFASLSSVHGAQDIVIIGGGVIGSSVAFHLSKHPRRQAHHQRIILLEQGQLTSGTTWHAAGLIGQLRPTQTETQISGVYGAKLYKELELPPYEVSTGFRQCGSFTLATSEARMQVLKRSAARARAFGVEAALLSPEETSERWGEGRLLNTEGLVGSLWLPGDGTANASDVTMAMATVAKRQGVEIFEGARVVGFEMDGDKITAINVVQDGEQSTIKLHAKSTVVNCAGQWARAVGKLCGVNVPLHSAQHFYIVSRAFSQPDPIIPPTLPFIRDPDAYTYYREWSGGLLVGSFEPHAMPAFEKSDPPADFQFSLFEENWDHFSSVMEGIINRVPLLEKAEVKMINGPESFTADNQYILGQAPNVSNFYVAAGFNSSGIASAGGAGNALSSWIVDGKPPFDLSTVDIRRFGNWSNNKELLRERVVESLGIHYTIHWPKMELMSARPLRRSALYDRLKNVGAAFGNKFGWERPNFYAETPEVAADLQQNPPYSFGRPYWFDYVKKEHLACRDNVVIFDQSSFAKLLIQGKDAEKFLQKMCAGNIAVPVGKCVYTSMLNERGGIETDITISRLAPKEFLLVTSTSQAVRDKHWLDSHLSEDDHVFITDITSMYSVISVMGPKSVELMDKVCSYEDSFADEDFPANTWKNIDIGLSKVRAHRLSYVGELGWELYVPPDFSLSVYDCLKENGKEFNVIDAGYYAIDTLRIEKCFRAWGHDIGPDDTPLEAGLSFAVDFNKEDFIGKQALVEQKKKGLKKRLVHFAVKDDSVNLFGNEPIYRNGALVGFVTSAAYGFKLGHQVALGYVKSPTEIVDAKFVKSGEYYIDVEGKHVPATATLARLL
jgi:glycine cleavage system aminomethyltransferase T/glycine/D-amino acid oxidase-like deaminating enzyme